MRVSCFVGSCLLGVSACGNATGADAVSCFGSIAEPLIGGQPAPIALRRVVPRLEVYDQAELVELCSGVAIAPNAIATAAHCVLRAGVEYRISIETETSLSDPPECSGGSTSTSSVTTPTSILTAPDLDLALLILSQDHWANGYLPVSGARTVNEGEFNVAGAGLGGDDSVGRLMTARAILVAESPQWLDVRIPSGGACDGDSGGPLLSGSAESSWAVVGTLSVGSSGCAGIDRFQRLSYAQKWLDEATGGMVTWQDGT